MAIRSYFLLFSLLLFQYSSSQPKSILQSDTINRTDSLGKKTGYWIEYVNNKLKLSSRDKAVFWKFVYYDNGYRTDFVGYASPRIYTLEVKGNEPEPDSIVILDGLYKLYDKKRRLVMEDIYKQGKLQIQKTFSIKTQKIIELINYKKFYKNKERSVYIEEYNDDGSLILKSCYQKINGKWKIVPLEK